MKKFHNICKRTLLAVISLNLSLLCYLQPVVSAEIQSFDASAFPGVDIYSLPPKAQRLVSTYRDLRREQESYRQSVLESIQNLDGALQQSLLKQTQLFRAEYVELEAPSGDSSFEDYKELLTDLDEELESELLTKNTYSLLNATRAYTNLGLFYNHLLRAMLLGYLPEDNVPSDPEEVDLLTDNLAAMTKPIQLVNYTARRLKALKNRLQNRYSQLSQDAEELKTSVTHLQDELKELTHIKLGNLLDEARAVGVEIDSSALGLSLPEPSPSASGADFGVQALPLAFLGLGAGGGIGAAFTSETALQLGAGLASAIAQATLAKLASDTVISTLNEAQQTNTRHTRSLERELTKSNLSPEERALQEAHLSELQASKDKLGDLITQAKQYREDAKRKAKEAGDAISRAEDQIKRNDKCKSRCQPVDQIRWKGFEKGKLKEHYEKHVVNQQEFGDITQNQYLNLALQFAKEKGEFNEYNIGGSIHIKHDPNTGRVLVGRNQERLIRTFYKSSKPSDQTLQEAIEEAKSKTNSNEVNDIKNCEK